jgi:catechol 2,3-dioxygenase-like lactoylglutathione lyase family enzyme
MTSTRAAQLAYSGELTCAMQVSDLDKSIAWYQSVLGFELLYRADDIGWCELQTTLPGVTVGLSQVESPRTHGGATLTFSVNDIDKARKTLETDKVRFDGETLTIPGLVRLATFFDPDGNKFMFSQSLQR